MPPRFRSLYSDIYCPRLKTTNGWEAVLEFASMDRPTSSVPPSGSSVPPSGSSVPPSGSSVPPSGSSVLPSGGTSEPCELGGPASLRARYGGNAGGVPWELLRNSWGLSELLPLCELRSPSLRARRLALPPASLLRRSAVPPEGRTEEPLAGSRSPSHRRWRSSAVPPKGRTGSNSWRK
ncbi:MAG: hypothetical protein BMS9Abin17_1737 [Acidimicrobiia bacterium]|nr:MAG: hypothetical protein BMS9Abin17_1737 [Acidimicrobiia bacterium]